MKKLLKTILIASVFPFSVWAQNEVNIGQWQVYVPFGDSHQVVDGGDRIYCTNSNSLYYINQADGSTQRYDRLSGLSDADIQTIGYNTKANCLVVAYSNANIDLLDRNGNFINLPDIKRKSIPGDKSIYSIFNHDQYAYVCCGFGIVVIDLERKEIKDTYYIGPNGNSTPVFSISLSNDGRLYAATGNGLLYVDINNPNLANYSEWTTMNFRTGHSFNLVQAYKNMVVANIPNKANTSTDSTFAYKDGSWKYMTELEGWRKIQMSIVNNELYVANFFNISVIDSNLNRYRIIEKFNNITSFCFDNYGLLWVTDPEVGLYKIKDKQQEIISLSGPKYNYTTKLYYQNQTLWVSTGTLATEYRKSGVMSYKNGIWRVFDKTNTPAFDTIKDTQLVLADPRNPNRIFVSSWGNGLLELKDGQVAQVYNPNNSTLEYVSPTFRFVGIRGMAFDLRNNLWISNRRAAHPISVMRADGNWYSFSAGNQLTEKDNIDLIIDDYNQKWVASDGGLLVFNDRGTLDDESDDRSRLLLEGKGNGGLLSKNITALAKDLDGNIWIGSDKGLSVHYGAASVLTGSNFDAQQIIIVQDGNAQYLLDTETITAIEVDASNKKWIGTKSGGLYLLSPDGTRQIQHFTTDNSPLLSNEITDVCIKGENGEVYIGTSRGLLSYRGTATEGGDSFSDVYAYPNPVPANYSGKIAVKGLATDVNVKITDISGRAVYETKAEGGQVIWDGTDFMGTKVKTGVYLVFCTNTDGSATMVTKIMFVN